MEGYDLHALMQEKTISIILAGAIGSRLHPLTAERAKPAVSFGGRYRIIDFTLSNCLHSGLRPLASFTALDTSTPTVIHTGSVYTKKMRSR